MLCISMHMQNLVKFHRFVLKILSRNEILTSINLRKLTCNNPNIDLVNENVYPKFGQISSIRSKDIERKGNSDKNHGSSRALTMLQIDKNYHLTSPT